MLAKLAKPGDKKNRLHELKRWTMPLLASLLMAGQAEAVVKASDYAELSLEDLGNIEITSVSKRSQKVRHAAASVHVITREDIRRAGAVSIPEALRLAPNLQVARYSSNSYAISARGFNTTTTNKLLVLIDGRTVYTPLYSGVFWDAQDTMMEDIERIEVISGPGATLWGANAVNGVINIITRSASDTQGVIVTATVGEEEKGAAVRMGGQNEQGVAYRMYAKGFDRGPMVNGAGNATTDAWHKGQGGFRIDKKGAQETWTLQGDVYRGSSEEPLRDNDLIEGANLLGRWQKTLANGHVQVQAYVDHTKRDYRNLFSDSLDTFDIEAQHRFTVGQHEILWGGGYRYANDKVDNTPRFGFLPAHIHLKNANLFIQDQVDLIPDILRLSIGSKFEHNNYSGLDIQPDARLSWKVNEHHQIWGGVSRAARAPSRIDRDWYIPLPPAAPAVLAGGQNFVSEALTAYQLGYRGQLSPQASISGTVFYNEYKKLRSIERDGSGVLFFSNRMDGTSHGLELSSELQLMPSWRVHAGYTYFEKSLHLPADNFNPAGINGEGNDARHHFVIRSLLELPNKIEFDSVIRHISALPSPVVPDYTSFDMRLGWRPVKNWELALIGQNLFDSQHPEFGTAATRSEIERSVFVKSTWRF